MRTFPTYYKDMKSIENFKRCVKKPIIVHSAQINEPFRVESLEGNYAQGNIGDYLMVGIDGELYICEKDIFERTYEYT